MGHATAHDSSDSGSDSMAVAHTMRLPQISGLALSPPRPLRTALPSPGFPPQDGAAKSGATETGADKGGAAESGAAEGSAADGVANEMLLRVLAATSGKTSSDGRQRMLSSCVQMLKMRGPVFGKRASAAAPHSAA